MSPIRHEDDFRRKQIKDWDEWIEDEIQKAQQRGEMDNLPLQGKPIEIYRTDVNPEYDLAFSRLKNAGIMPAWMELEREIRQLTEELASFLDRSEAYLAEQRKALRRSLAGEADEEPAKPSRPWWQVWWQVLDWLRFPPEEPARPTAPRSTGELLQLRDHLRAEYLARAAALDKKIVDYHNSLPRELTHLERLRMLPERAAKRFDERIPVGFVLEADLPTEGRQRG